MSTIKELDTRVATTAAAMDESTAILREAEAKAGELNTAIASAQEAVQVSEDAYVKNATPKAGREVTEAREALALAKLRFDPTPARARADAAREAAQAAVDAHERAIADHARALRVAELRIAADQGTLHDAVRPHWQRFHDAVIALEESAEAIDAARAASHAASRELEAMGVHDAPLLGDVHAAIPILEKEVDAGRGHLLHDYEFGRLCWAISNGMVISIFDLAKSLRAPSRRQGGKMELPIEAARSELAFHKATRTHAQAEELRSNYHKEAEAERRAERERSYVLPTRDGMHTPVRLLDKEPAEPR